MFMGSRQAALAGKKCLQGIFLFLLVALSCLPLGCSSDREEKASEVDRLTDQVAREAVEKIREPMEKARQVQAIQDAHMKAVDKAVQEAQ